MEERFLSNTPIVLSVLDGYTMLTSELLTDGCIVLLVKSGDFDELQDHLDRFIKNDGMYPAIRREKGGKLALVDLTGNEDIFEKEKFMRTKNLIISPEAYNESYTIRKEPGINSKEARRERKFGRG